MRELLLKLKKNKVDIQVEKGELRLGLPNGFNDDDLLSEVKKNKTNIIDYFESRNVVNIKWDTITSAPVKEYYPVSPQQQRLFILYQLSPDSLAYNMPQAFKIKRTSVDLNRLEKTFNALIKRHEILRTTFHVLDKKVFQKVSPEYTVCVEKYQPDQGQVESVVSKFIRPFNLQNGPLLRLGLIDLDNQYVVLLLDIHHIIFDGTSQQLLLKELELLYNGEALLNLDIQYKDYSEWYHNVYADQVLKHKDFWCSEFVSPPMHCELPTDFKRSTKKDFSGETIYFSVNKEITTRLYKLAKRARSSLFAVLFSAYGILISRLANQDDIVIGTPTAGRTHPGLDKMLGLFVNTLPVRFFLDGESTYKNYLDNLNLRLLSCFDHQNYPLDKLIGDLSLSRTLDHNPLFDVFFVMQNVEKLAINTKGLEIDTYKLSSHQTSKFDISLAAEETEGSLNFNFEFSTQLFNISTIKRFIEYFKHILLSIVDNEDITLSEIDMLSSQEKEYLLRVNNNQQIQFPADQNVVSLFEKQVQRSPHKVAIKDKDIELTYDELNRKSNAVAKNIIAAGCTPNTVVALYMGKTYQTVIGMLAILKAGGAYMPIDIDYPQERVLFLLKDSQVDLVVTEKKDASIFGDNCTCIFIDELVSNDQNSTNLNLAISPDDLCYIIYTSGTTGMPKGVMVEHKNVVRLFFNNEFQFRFSQNDVWTMFHSHCFDFSVWEIYGALLYGGKVIILKKEDAIDPSRYFKILIDEKVTILNQTPTAFYSLIQEDIKENYALKHIRYVIFGGEALTPSKLKKWHANYTGIKLINMFGITETTVHVTYKEIAKLDMEQNISNIGRPISTTSLYLFDKYKRLVPTGVIGELYVGGGGVSRGYLNNTILTKERFVTNPHDSNDRLYKTGDLARMLPNGEIEYLGRADHQINLKGFRIEPGEIEFNLTQHPLVSNAVVIVKTNERGDKLLCAYYVSAELLYIEDIRSFLQERLPTHMIPSHFIPIEDIPVTKNNKIDIGKLPEPGHIISSNFVAPRNEIEMKLGRIWAEELSLEEVSITDSFFNLGGDSLKAINLIYEINTQFQSNISIADLYFFQTIERLTPHLKAQSDIEYESVLRAEKDLKLFQENYKQNETWDDSYESVYPMNAIEKGMTFYSMKMKGRNASINNVLYHEQNIYDIRIIGFDIDLFRKSLSLLVDKHSDLRKIYDLHHFAHIVKKNITPELNYIDLSSLNTDEQQEYIVHKVHSEKLKATRLDHAILWRMNIIKLHDDLHVLVFDMHHSLFDGWSLQSFITELNNTYDILQTDPLYKPEKLRCSYRDHILSEMIELQKGPNFPYWQNELKEFNRLNFFKKNDTNRNENKTIILGDDLRIKLETLAKEVGTSFKHLCIAAYTYSMQLCSFEKDIVVGLITNNRPLVADGEKLLGCFLNTVPFRINNPGSQTWRDYLLYIEGKLIELKKHEKIPFQEIVKQTHERTHSGNPLFDTSFNYTDFWILNEMHSLSEDTEDLYLDKVYYRSFMRTNMLCDFNVTPNYGFKLHITYSTSYFDESHIDKLLQLYKNTLVQFVERTDEVMNAKQVLSPKESEQLLNGFNNNMIAYSLDKTVVDMFVEQVHKNYEKTAVKYLSNPLSYKELYNKSTQVAARLQSLNIKKNGLVGILLDPSELLVPSILGVLLSGSAFVPIDNDYPTARKKYILENSGLNVLVSTAKLVANNDSFLADFPTENIIDIESVDYNEISLEVDLPKVLPGDLAYVLYTSGSTGKPKGVMINHGALFNYLSWASDIYIKEEDAPMALFSSISFDLTITSLFLPLVTGNTLHVYEHSKQTIVIDKVVADGYAKILKLTPSHLRILIDQDADLTNVRRIIVGGEQFDTGLAKDTCNRGGEDLEIYNEYGPTEATIGCVLYRYDCSESEIRSNVLIGKPAPNNKIYILDEQLDLLPVGLPGEVYIGGTQLLTGYISLEDTNEKLITNPFKEGELIYKTGDLAKWDHTGNLEYLGRTDDQVKIRGYRIELGEIENQLMLYPEIEGVVVTTSEKEGNKHLVCYYVADREISSLEFQNYLSVYLPSYMVPTYFVHLNNIPLTSNGKANRKMLPVFEVKAGADYKAPSSEIEKTLVELWSQVLGIDKEHISTNKGFFDLGGDSISLLRLHKKIEDNISQQITIPDLFRYPTVQAITHFIAGDGFDKDELKKRTEDEVSGIQDIINELEI